MKPGRYYLGRVVKLGRLTQDMLVEAILDSPVISSAKYEWAITDAFDGRRETPPFVYGELSKFRPVGDVTVVDLEEKAKVEQPTKNLHEASAPFVYLPDFSGIAYLHVWNQIQKDVFPRRFKAIIEKAHDNFFVQCNVEAVSDYSDFVAKMGRFERFTQISAKVHPPNPLFGRLWKSLKDYIEKRNVEELLVKETGDEREGIDTEIYSLMQNLLENSQYDPLQPPSITDAALLMAADGYGRGKVVGIAKGEFVTIWTSETKKSFLFDKKPDPRLLAQKAWDEFNGVEKERDMEHP